MSKEQSQEYRVNGEQIWEAVALHTWRLRVPGGWLYQSYDANSSDMCFVPMPEVVKHKV